MIATAQALYSFFSGFGIPAYTEDTVPDDAELPYLTYPLIEPEWRQKHSFYVQVYYRHQTSNLDSLRKADEIVEAIGDCAKLKCNGGYVVLRPENPLIQEKPPDNDIRAAYINLSINAYHMPGV